MEMPSRSSSATASAQPKLRPPPSSLYSRSIGIAALQDRSDTHDDPLTMMEVKVLYFASAREEIGLREEKLQLPVDDGDKNTITLASLRRLLMEKYPHAAATIENITLARNLEYSEDDVELQGGDEVALIPPISGG